MSTADSAVKAYGHVRNRRAKLVHNFDIQHHGIARQTIEAATAQSKGVEGSTVADNVQIRNAEVDCSARDRYRPFVNASGRNGSRHPHRHAGGSTWVERH